jgi:hypothetical protein
MERTISFRLQAATLAVIGALGLTLAGCDGNQDPGDGYGRMRVDISGLKQQFNAGGPETQATGVTASPSETRVRSVIIGAVVITFQGSPLNSDSRINDDNVQGLIDDLINSVNFFTIVDLPTAADEIEFKVPPPGAGGWQVAAVGSRARLATFDDLKEENVIYYGFDENEGQFRTTSAGAQPSVTLDMKRACFLKSPPLGCAAFGDERQATVTGSVEILGMELDGTAVPTGTDIMFPIFTRATANTGSWTPGGLPNCTETDTCSTAVVAAGLEAVADLSGAGTVRVLVSHRQANNQTSACQSATAVGSLDPENPTPGSLSAECGFSDFFADYSIED